MPEFVQIMRFRTSDFDTLNRLTEQYRSDTAGEVLAATAFVLPAIEIIDRVAELDGRDEARAKYAYTVGVVMRDELKDAD